MSAKIPGGLMATVLLATGLTSCQAVDRSKPPVDDEEPPVLRRALEVGYETFERDVRFEDLPQGDGLANRTVELTFNRATARGAFAPFEETAIFFELLAEAVDEDAFVEGPRLDGRGLRLGFEAQPSFANRLRADAAVSGAWVVADETELQEDLEMRYAELYAQLGIGWDIISSKEGGLDGPARLTARIGGYFDGIRGRYRLDLPGPAAIRDDLTTGGGGVYLGVDAWSRPLLLRGIAWFGEREGIGLVVGWTF